ncbi:SulP family inorganic anion transporter [Nocardioides sp.]|uniref:SulP family inorganic anion transporter n=1 Tax=Nocardioides sp. TaxID=35761 RepID=UPI00286E93CB|nr:SulP family inorganic anion transporter [Nocardioides sp.]
MSHAPTQHLDDAARRLRSLLPTRDDLVSVRRDQRQNLVAGLTVAIVALPLALAFGAASGLGAQAGLVTAVVAGIVAAVFGGSNIQVSGPTGAMTVVLVPVVHQHGVTGVLMVGMLAGVVLVAMAVARLGRFVRYLPVSVIEGFTAGIAVVIALQQVPSALGVTDASGDKVWAIAADAVQRFTLHPSAAPLIISVTVATLMLAGARWRPRVPFSLIGVALATAGTHLFDLHVATLGHLPASLPAPSLGFVDLGAISALTTAALAIAALAALESLLCATVADAMTVDEHHDPDRELFGQGLANIVVPLFGGVPATAAIARTAVNVRAGATSRLAAVTHSLVLLALVFVAAPLVSSIPLAALSGVLFATCVRMVETGALRALLRSTRSDAVIVCLTFLVTVFVDLVSAVGVGVGVAVVLALRSVARTARLEEVPIDTGDHSAQEHALLSEHIVVYRIDGPLFFGAAHRLLLELPDIVDVDVVILRMSRVTTLDATGANVLADAITRLERRGIVVLLSGLATEHDDVLRSLGTAAALRDAGRILPDTPTAIALARSLLSLPGPAVPGHRSDGSQADASHLSGPKTS